MSDEDEQRQRHQIAVASEPGERGGGRAQEKDHAPDDGERDRRRRPVGLLAVGKDLCVTARVAGAWRASFGSLRTAQAAASWQA